MGNVTYIPNDKGAFVILNPEGRIGEMIVGMEEDNIFIYHTGVIEKLQGQGYGKQLIHGMADYARAHRLKVIIYCPFVKSYFISNKDKYADIWDIEVESKYVKLK